MPSTTASAASRKRIVDALHHRQPDQVPIDFGGTNCSGLHCSCVAALRDYYGLEKRLVRVYEPYMMLGLLDEDLQDAMRVDVTTVYPRMTKFGFPIDSWKSWRLNGLEVMVPGQFNTKLEADGGILIYPQGDMTVAPSGRMPSGGYFFDHIVRQDPIDEDKLNPEENLEEYQPVSAADIEHFARASALAAATGRGVVASFGGTSLGDIGILPGAGLKHPKGIRDTAEWYMSIRSRQDYIHKVFQRQCETAIGNLERIHAVVGDKVDAVSICGTDFGTQTSSFCSVDTFRSLYFPYYKHVCDWIHAHTPWKTFKHSCGAVRKFLPSFIEAGIDILNPVQCSAAGMDPRELKAEFGEHLVFWGGGVDTQHTLPFGTPEQVREQVLSRCEVFAPGGGFVFNAIHNVQAQTPVENLVAMIDAVHEFNGRK